MKKKLVSISLVLLCVSCFSYSPSLLSIVEGVKSHNPDYITASISAAQAELEAAAGRKEQVFNGSASAEGAVQGSAASDPAVTPLAGSRVSAVIQAPAGAKIQAGADYSISLGDALKTDALGLSVSASIPVFVNGRFIDSSLTKAAEFVRLEAPFLAAKTAAEKRQVSVLDAVLRLALDTEALERRLVIAQKRLDLSAKEAEVARIQWESGNTGFSVYDRAQKACDEARLAMQDIINMRNTYLTNLRAACGIEDLDVRDLTIPPPVQVETLETLSGISSEIAQAELQVKAAQMSSILTGAQYAPTLSLSGRASFPDTFIKTEGFESNPAWSASLSVSIPIPTGAQKLRKEASQLKQEAAMQEEISAGQRVMQQIETLIAEYKMACERETLRSQMLLQAQSRFKEVERSFETETATALDKERAQLSVLEAESMLRDEGASRFKATLSVYTYFGIDPVQVPGLE